MNVESLITFAFFHLQFRKLMLLFHDSREDRFEANISIHSHQWGLAWPYWGVKRYSRRDLKIPWGEDTWFSIHWGFGRNFYRGVPFLIAFSQFFKKILQLLYSVQEYSGMYEKPDLATLCNVHKLHVKSIPYMNLTIPCGERKTLDLQIIYEKIGRNHHGGWCCENNLLFFCTANTPCWTAKSSTCSKMIRTTSSPWIRTSLPWWRSKTWGISLVRVLECGTHYKWSQLSTGTPLCGKRLHWKKKIINSTTVRHFNPSRQCAYPYIIHETSDCKHKLTALPVWGGCFCMWPYFAGPILHDPELYILYYTFCAWTLYDFLYFSLYCPQNQVSKSVRLSIIHR